MVDLYESCSNFGLRFLDSPKYCRTHAGLSKYSLFMKYPTHIKFLKSPSNVDFEIHTSSLLLLS